MSQNSYSSESYRGQSNSSSQSPELWAIVIGGAALAVYGLSRRSKSGLALAAAGGLLAATNARKQINGEASHDAHASFQINCSPEEAYNFWRKLENLPRFMRHLKSVRDIGGNRSEWTALGPLDKPVRWTAEITEDRPNERIAWQSLADSDVQNSGSVTFQRNTGGRGTLVTAHINYVPPAGTVGKTVATVLGKNPQFVVKEDLRRFKSLLEAGEIPTTLGQTHGPRGIHGKVEQVLFREPQNQLPPQAAKTQPQRMSA